MREAFYQLTVATPEGQRWSGRVVTAQRWRSELGDQELPAGEDFLIVILGQEPPETPTVTRPAIALCLPAAPIARARSFGEPLAPYQAAPSLPPALSRAALTALAKGRILTREPLDIQPQELFLPEQERAMLDLLAQALIRQRQQAQAWEEAQPYLQALAAGLHLPAVGSPDAPAVASILASLQQVVKAADEAAASLMPIPEEITPPAEIIARLEQLAACQDGLTFLAVARESYRGPLELAEDVFFCRALRQDPPSALETARMQAFVARAEVPPSLHELFTDRAAQREDLAFSVVADHPHSFASVRSRFQIFRKRYQRAYLAHHQRYWRESAQIRLDLQEAGPKFSALQRLNTLRQLGPPLGQEVAARYQDLLAATSGCPLEPDLEAALREAPLCPVCNATLGHEPPRQQAQELFHEMERALSQQLQRLSNQAVGRILSRRSEGRLERFLKVAQASDLSGLAALLDDRLLEFLRQLLAEARVRVPLPPLLEQLGRSYPEVGEEELEEVTQTFARLLRQALQAARPPTPPGDP
ncbi:MAG: hypothetical protein ACE5IZ_00250 [Dehalococcoidia bacterium]